MSERPTFADAREVAGGGGGAVRGRRGRPGAPRLHPLPLGRLPGGRDPPAAAAARARRRGADEPAGRRPGYTEFEPDVESLLAELAPSAVESEIFTALLEGAASFFTAQQRAMAAASDNADELIRTLSRIMNRARQDAITTEIMEIVGGAEALRQSKGA